MYICEDEDEIGRGRRGGRENEEEEVMGKVNMGSGQWLIPRWERLSIIELRRGRSEDGRRDGEEEGGRRGLARHELG